MNVIFVGYNHIHDSDFNITRPLGSGDYLILLIRSTAIFTIDKQDIYTEPNTFFLYEKNVPQFYRANKDLFINDWIHLELDENDEKYFKSLKIPAQTPIKINDIEFFSSIINCINIEHYSSNEFKKDTIDSYLHIFFNKLHEYSALHKSESNQKNYDKFSLLRSKIYRRPYLKWTITNLSHQICLSPSYFQYMYKKHFGVTCIADIINARIEYAKQLLKTTCLTIHHISEQCGYENDVHFMRQFKRLTGKTPSQYRSENLSPNTMLDIKHNKPDIF